MKSKLVASSQQPAARKNPATHLLRATSYRLQANRGFTVLLAALVASVTLALGISIFEITQKQIMLSSLGRDSQFAFYSADTGAECALYWDIRHEYFGTSTPPNLVAPDDPACAGQKLNATGRPQVGEQNPYPYTMRFQFNTGGLCSQVTVKKDSADPRTVIHADGFSANCNSLGTNPRTLQRSLEIRY